MRGQRAVVGIDLGTSGVKVLVAGFDGAAAAPWPTATGAAGLAAASYRF